MCASSAIPLWDDTQLKPGDDWKRNIEQAVSTARIELLLGRYAGPADLGLCDPG